MKFRHDPISLLWCLIAAFLIVFSLAPLVAYGVFHIGNVAMLAAAAAMLISRVTWEEQKQEPKLWMAIRRICLMVSVLFLCMNVFCLGYYAYLQKTDVLPEGNEVVVVLGCQVHADGHPSLMLQGRIDAAYTYLTQRPEAICIVSGGQGPDEPITESSCMKRELIDMGINGDRIYEESLSHNTEQNMRFTAQLANEIGFDGSATIVTDNFHQIRGTILLERTGMKVCNHISSSALPILQVCYWVREAGGTILILFGVL